VRRARPAKLHRRRPLTGLWAPFLPFVLLLVLLMGHALPALHFAVVAHEVCEEHGQVHHSDGVDRVLVLGADSSRLAGEAQASAGDSGSHGHEHCGLSAAGSERVALGRETRVERGSPAAVSPNFFGRSAAKPSIALLRYAPKLAPPV